MNSLQKYPQAYVEYLISFHAERDYFECHEILEEYWIERERKEKVWVGLIQVAVSLYHQRRQNFPGALKLMRSAYNKLKNEQTHLEKLGLDVQKTLNLLLEQIEKINNRQAYESIHLPIRDPRLLEMCKQLCQERDLTWGLPSDLDDEYLIHKHILRNRHQAHERSEDP